MHPRHDIRALARVAFVLTLPLLGGCDCGSGKAPTETGSDCPPPPPPRCEVNGELVYNLGRGMFSDSASVKCSSAAGPAAACSWPSPGPTTNSAWNDSAPTCNSPLARPAFPALATEMFDENVPGVVPAIVLIPSAGSAPAREVRQDGKDGAVGASASISEPKAQTPDSEKPARVEPADAPDKSAETSKTPEIPKTSEALETPSNAPGQADNGIAAAPARALTMVGKYEKLPDGPEKTASSPDAGVSAAIEEPASGAPASEPDPDSALPRVELPPNLD